MEISVNEAASFCSAFMIKQSIKLQKQNVTWGDGPFLTESLQKDIDTFVTARSEAEADEASSDIESNTKARLRIQQGGSDLCSAEVGVPADHWMQDDDSAIPPGSGELENIQRNAKRTFSLDGFVAVLQEHLAVVEESIGHAGDLSAEGAEVWTPKNDSKYHLLSALTRTVDDHEVTVEEAIHFVAGAFLGADAEAGAKELLTALPGFVNSWATQLAAFPRVHQPFVQKAISFLEGVANRTPSKLNIILECTKLLRDVLAQLLAFADKNAEVWRIFLIFAADFATQMQKFPAVYPPLADSAANLISAMAPTGTAAGEETASNALLELVTHIQGAVSGKKAVRFSAMFRKLARKVALKHTLTSFANVITFGYFSTALEDADEGSNTGDAASALYAASDLMDHLEQLYEGDDEGLAGFSKAADTLAAALEEAGREAAKRPADWTAGVADAIRVAGSTYPAHISGLRLCIQSGFSASACRDSATADGISAAVELAFIVAKTAAQTKAVQGDAAVNFMFLLSGGFLYPKQELVDFLKGRDANDILILEQMKGLFQGLNMHLAMMLKKTELGGLVAVGSPLADRLAQVRRAVLNGYEVEVDKVMNNKSMLLSKRTKVAHSMAMEVRLAWLPLLAVARFVDVARGALPLFPATNSEGDGASSGVDAGYLRGMLETVSQISDDVQWTIFCSGTAPDDELKCSGPSVPILPETFWTLTADEVQRWQLATDLISTASNAVAGDGFPENTFIAATTAIVSAKEVIKTAVEPFANTTSQEELALKVGVQTFITMLAASKLAKRDDFNNGWLHEMKHVPFKGRWNEKMKNKPELKPILKDRFEFAVVRSLATALEAAADVNNDGTIDAADSAALSKGLEFSDVKELLEQPFTPFFDGVAWIVDGANNQESPVGLFLVHAIMDILAGGSISSVAELATFSGCAALGAFIDVTACDLYRELNDGLLGGNAADQIEGLQIQKSKACSSRWAATVKRAVT